MATEIISKGRCVQVSEAELDDLRADNLGWFAYCQARLTRGHHAAIEHMTRYRCR